MSKIIVLCPAKINLFLNIVGQSGNMHLLNMVNQTVDLYDYITIETNNTGKINITCNNDGIPLNQENTCFKAALSMKANFGIKYGFDIHIQKNIPIGAGLGGESTDAAGVILGINEMLKLYIPQKFLFKIGENIGSDVPFCMVGGTALIENTCEITPVPTEFKHFLIVKPNFSIITKAAFAEYDRRLTDYKKFLTFAIGYNDLECVAPKEIQDIKIFFSDMYEASSNMTGSGSAVVVHFLDEETRLQAYRDAGKYFQNYYEYYCVNSCNGIQFTKKMHLN